MWIFNSALFVRQSKVNLLKWKCRQTRALLLKRLNSTVCGGRPKANTKISGGWFEPVSTFWSFFCSRYIFLVRLFQIFFPNPTPFSLSGRFFLKRLLSNFSARYKRGSLGPWKKNLREPKLWQDDLSSRLFFCSSDQARFASRHWIAFLRRRLRVADVVERQNKYFNEPGSNLALNYSILQFVVYCSWRVIRM